MRAKLEIEIATPPVGRLAMTEKAESSMATEYQTSTKENEWL
jgi:hypothetical protein